MELSTQAKQVFLDVLWGFYARCGRSSLSWRQPETNGNFDPYKIMVSELMLQQTQVSRVIPKYEALLQQFPTAHALAAAELGEVLRAWQGLGYNRRAKYLWQAAQIVDKLNHFPNTKAELAKLPGIGPNTTGAILAYTYNLPVVFIETNIRTVYIHHFFADRTDVSDTEITQLVEQTLDQENPREFYWALMDYGSHLKASVGNLNKASKHYSKQPAFHGSRRQVRGAVIRFLGDGSMSLQELRQAVPDGRLESVLGDLVDEGLVCLRGGTYSL